MLGTKTKHVYQPLDSRVKTYAGCIGAAPSWVSLSICPTGQSHKQTDKETSALHFLLWMCHRFRQ